MTVIYLLASVQALFLFSVLLAKQQKSVADNVLMIWLAGIGIHTLIYFLYFQFHLYVPLVVNLNAAFPFLQGPFLLAYVAAIIGMRDRFAGPDYLHLLPFAGFIAYLLLTSGLAAFSISTGEHSRNISIFSMANLFTVLLLLSVPFYIAWSLVLMRRVSRVLQGPALPGRFRWIRFFIAGLGVVWVMAMISFALSQSEAHQSPPHLVFWALTVLVYGLGYLGLTRTSVFSRSELAVLKKQLQPKYQKSGLKPDDAKAAHKRLVALIENQQVYLDGDLSLQSLAQELNLSTNHLSQVINEFEQCGFHDFINTRRVAKACDQLQNNPNANLLELAMDVGFNSKSSFNRAFRKFTGKTPSEFIARS
jgi:AraC-like DNA-binding protein